MAGSWWVMLLTSAIAVPFRWCGPREADARALLRRHSLLFRFSKVSVQTLFPPGTFEQSLKGRVLDLVTIHPPLLGSWLLPMPPVQACKGDCSSPEGV
eukprot:1155333-Pelagomonas_calceolata.AAC.4